MGRVGLAAADAKKLDVGVMQQNFREDMPALSQRLYVGLVQNASMAMWRAMY